MTLAACPRCKDQVTLPVGASPKATVRCPLCQAEFALSEILDGLPPALIVISDPEPLAVRAPLAAAGVVETARPVTADDSGVEPLDHVEDLLAESLDEEVGEPRIRVAEPGGAEADEWGATPAFAIRERDGAEAAAPEAARRRAPAAARLQKKGTHPILKIGGLAVAGVCGAVFAQMVLWWLPWDVFPNRDPVDLGPKVAGVIPWIVPKTLRGGDVPGAVSQGTQKPPSEPQIEHPKPAQPPRPQGKNAGKSKDPSVKLSDSGLPIQEFVEPGPGQPAGKKKPVDEEMEKPNPADLTSNPLLDNMPVTPLTEDAKPEPVPPAKESPAEPPMESPPVERLKNAPAVSAEDFTASLAKAQQATENWAPASYMALLKLAETLTLAGEIEEADANTAIDLIAAVAKDPKRLELLAKAGPRFMNTTRADGGTGLLLVGVVKQITARGELFETQLEVTPGESPVSVFSDVDPAQDYQPNDRLLIVGVFVNKPAESLVGYTGDAASVVWAGYCEVLGK